MPCRQKHINFYCKPSISNNFASVLIFCVKKYGFYKENSRECDEKTQKTSGKVQKNT